jgi:glycine cleavage system regulatory protein
MMMRALSTRISMAPEARLGTTSAELFELSADRASPATMRANQLRMWLSAMAYAWSATPCVASVCAT